MGYGEYLEWLSGQGIDTSYADNGINPFRDSRGERDEPEPEADASGYECVFILGSPDTPHLCYQCGKTREEHNSAQFCTEQEAVARRKDHRLPAPPDRICHDKSSPMPCRTCGQ